MVIFFLSVCRVNVLNVEHTQTDSKAALQLNIFLFRITGRIWSGASPCPSSRRTSESVSAIPAFLVPSSSLVRWPTLPGKDCSGTSRLSLLLLVSCKTNFGLLSIIFSYRARHHRRGRQVWYCEVVRHQRHHGQGQARVVGRDAQRRGQVELRPVLPHRDPGQGRHQADHQGLPDRSAKVSGA